MGNFIDTASLIGRSAENHLRYFSPAAEGMVPPQYAGKVESTCATMALDLMDVSMREISDPHEFARFIAGWNLLFRANDEVVDVAKPYTDELVTVEDLNNTPIFHKYAGPAGRTVTGSEGLQIVLNSASRIIPGNSTGSIRRRAAVEELAHTYTQAVADTANNPAYHQGNVLPFPVAMRSKTDVTALLGETSVGLIAALLDIPDRAEDKVLYGQIGMAMQFCDDLFDWRKDWREHRTRAQQSVRPLRPQENLFNAMLQEYGAERQACEEVLADTSRRSAIQARERAPETLAALQAEFRDIVDQFPVHPYRDRATKIVNFLLYKVIPWAPESGRFSRWAKY